MSYSIIEKFGTELVNYSWTYSLLHNQIRAQRKIPVDLHFLQHRHKAGGASPLGVACAACFEQLACVFASCGDIIDIFGW